MRSGPCSKQNVDNCPLYNRHQMRIFAPKKSTNRNTNNLSIIHTMDKTLSQRFGSTVVRLRKERGISQETFANQASIDRHYMSDIENGRRNISLDIIEKIAKSLQLPISVLFNEVEKEQESYEA